MKSGFVKHLFLWLLIIPLITVFTLPLFFSLDDYKISPSEFDMHERMIGKESHEKAIDAAKVIYRKLIYPMSDWMCATEFSSELDTQGVDWILKQSNQSRCQSLLRGFYRIQVELSFLFGVLILAIAAFYDGAMQRSIGKYEFGYNNPVAFHLVTHSLISVIGLTFIGVFLPVIFTFWYYLGYCIVIVIASWLISKNFQTGA